MKGAELISLKWVNLLLGEWVAKMVDKKVGVIFDKVKFDFKIKNQLIKVQKENYQKS
ncbi:hypothetical protein VAA_00135 [Vibrio anguillarum 775]|nr:hypothetical protein VAA_00135 [Vibrio anguillarum 775]